MAPLASRDRRHIFLHPNLVKHVRFTTLSANRCAPPTTSSTSIPRMQCGSSASQPSAAGITMHRCSKDQDTGRIGPRAEALRCPRMRRRSAVWVPRQDDDRHAERRCDMTGPAVHADEEGRRADQGCASAQSEHASRRGGANAICRDEVSEGSRLAGIVGPSHRDDVHPGAPGYLRTTSAAVRSSGHCRRPAANGATASNGCGLGSEVLHSERHRRLPVRLRQVELEPRLALAAERIEKAERVLHLVTVPDIEKGDRQVPVEARVLDPLPLRASFGEADHPPCSAQPRDPRRTVEVGVPARHQREVEGRRSACRARNAARSSAEPAPNRTGPLAAAGTAMTRSTSRHGAARS